MPLDRPPHQRPVQMSSVVDSANIPPSYFRASDYRTPSAQLLNQLTPRTHPHYGEPQAWEDYVTCQRSRLIARDRVSAAGLFAVRDPIHPQQVRHLSLTTLKNRYFRTQEMVETIPTHARILVSDTDSLAIRHQLSPHLLSGQYTTVSLPTHSAILEYCGGSQSTYYQAVATCISYRMRRQAVAVAQHETGEFNPVYACYATLYYLGY
jgi:hypothetical protein